MPAVIWSALLCFLLQGYGAGLVWVAARRESLEQKQLFCSERDYDAMVGLLRGCSEAIAANRQARATAP